MRKYKNLFNLRARNFLFPKYKEFFQDKFLFVCYFELWLKSTPAGLIVLSFSNDKYQNISWWVILTSLHCYWAKKLNLSKAANEKTGSTVLFVKNLEKNFWRSQFFSKIAEWRPATTSSLKILYYRLSVVSQATSNDLKKYMLWCNDFYPDILVCFKGSSHYKMSKWFILIRPDKFHGEYF